MKKKFLAMLLACAALFTAGCESIGKNSSQWIDSSIKGNVTADTVVSLKDDFAAAANQDLYASGESEGRTIVNISRRVTDRKRALLSDTSVTGKGIEEVRKYAALAEDHAGRQALGVTPLEPYLRSIEGITSVEELYAWIADPAANPLGASPVAVTGPGRSQVAPSSYFVLLGNASFTLTRQNSSSDSYFSMNETDLEKMVMVEDKVTCVLEQMGYTKDQIQALLDYVDSENKDGKPVVMTGHTAVEGMDYTGHDFKGNVKTIKTDKLGTGYDYLALGHIHRPQTIGHEEDLNDEIVNYPAGVIRYSGSALHVSCDERYRHSVSLVDIDRHGGNVRIQLLFINELRHFHILPSDKESYHSLEETIDGVKAFIQNGGKGYFRLHIDYDAQIPSDINQTIYTLIENDDELRYNPKIIWKGEEEAQQSETTAPTFEIADLQQMTDPMHFIERTIDRYPQFTLE